MTLRPLTVEDLQRGVAFVCRPGQPLLIGRDDPASEALLRCRDPHVSRRHCELDVVGPGRIRVRDFSSYGTFADGERVVGERVVGVGTRLTLGSAYHLHIRDDTEPATLDLADAATGALAEIPTPAMQVSPPVRLGGSALGLTGRVVAQRYAIGKELGRGGMGLVYFAQDQHRRGPCAFKLLRALAPSPEAVARFRAESTLGERLAGCPGVIAAYDSGALPTGELYCAMDFVAGAPLQAWVRRGGVTVPRRLRWIADVARAVQHAHDRRVLHRDLKPGNVLITERDEVYLMDFGIAKALDEASGITITGASLGTPNYMAPEQITDSKRVDHRADVYGLGAMLYAALAGHPPFQDQNLGPGKILGRARYGGYTPLDALCPSLPEPVVDLCARAMALQPDDRPPTALALAHDLDDLARDLTQT